MNEHWERAEENQGSCGVAVDAAVVVGVFANIIGQGFPAQVPVP